MRFFTDLYYHMLGDFSPDRFGSNSKLAMTFLEFGLNRLLKSFAFNLLKQFSMLPDMRVI